MSDSESTIHPDPLKSVADAMEAAVLAAKDGASQARESVANAFPEAGNMLARLAYNTSYAISYGLVFPAVFVAKSVPQNNALIHGLADGARAAIDTVSEMRSHKGPGG
jgi:hypothetical protein